MPNYKATNYQQTTMVVINYEDQLQAGTFEYPLHYLIENKLDLSIFDECYKNEGTGRAAYNPAVLLKIVLFAYSKGITSSREIQWCCQNNIIFKALSCGQRVALNLQDVVNAVFAGAKNGHNDSAFYQQPC